MKLFGTRKEARPDLDMNDLSGVDNALLDESGELNVYENRKVVSRARSDAEASISDAAKTSLRDLTMIRKGRCPECGGRTETLVFSSICPACGWFRRYESDFISCVVHQHDGEPIHCERVFNVAGGYVLCVKNDMVICQLAGSAVRRIDFSLPEEQMQTARKRFSRENAGHCAWCETAMANAPDPDAPILEYVAFGSFQERYLFCSRTCLEAFRRQYPVRVHRNCYETECNICKACVKRYDTEDFHRVVLADYDD